MKKTKYLLLALAVSLLFVSLVACGGTSLKDDYNKYANNKYNAIFVLENNDIVKTYSDALDSKNDKTILKALSETLPAKNDALLEKIKAYTPETTEIQALHNIYIQGVEIRKEAYAQLYEAFTTKVSDESATDKALDKLEEADTKFAEFETKANSIKKELGIVDSK
jgi:hypothetical protein